jgi:cytosine/adenosine deaminase-related metal-dependent hydrolase
MERPVVIAGKALVGEELELQPVTIVIANGMITAIEETAQVPDIWICPALFNAHTHLGDTVAMDYGTEGDLVDLVTPPFGLKHRLLNAASYNDIVAGMRASIGEMVSRGTGGCADFREGGLTGVAALREAALGQSFRCVIFGRDGGERNGDGLGVSSTRDVVDLERIIADAKQQNKPVAIHAGEKDPGDVDAALAYDPDLIIHATHATDAQLRECAERSIPVVVCPRSNWTLRTTTSSAHPPIARMLDLGCTVFLGTDNAMFVQPDLFAEMSFVHTLYNIHPSNVMRMAVAGSCVGGEPFFIKDGARANLFSIDPRFSNLRFSKDPIASIVKRAVSCSIGTNVFIS